jgi:hypothetical protein
MESLTIERIAADLTEVLGGTAAEFSTSRRDEAEPAEAVALPYVAWITPDRGTPKRVDIAPVHSKEEALQLATLAGRALFPGRAFHAMARPA